MKVALIPPKGLYHVAEESDIAMMLALDVCISDPNYVPAFDGLEFRILDNGLAEGFQMASRELLGMCSEYNVSEVVVPDTYKDAKRTLVQARAFFKQHEKELGDLQTMVVLQGKTYEELRELAIELDGLPVTTIGIPRHLLDTTSQSAVRIDMAHWIEKHFEGRFLIHFLGASARWPREVLAIKRYCGYVRSIDTSMPFNYTRAGKRVDDPNVRIDRPTRYFERAFPFDDALLAHNIDTYLNWAH